MTHGPLPKALPFKGNITSYTATLETNLSKHEHLGTNYMQAIAQMFLVHIHGYLVSCNEYVMTYMAIWVAFYYKATVNIILYVSWRT